MHIYIYIYICFISARIYIHVSLLSEVTTARAGAMSGVAVHARGARNLRNALRYPDPLPNHGGERPRARETERQGERERDNYTEKQRQRKTEAETGTERKRERVCVCV